MAAACIYKQTYEQWLSVHNIHMYKEKI